MPRPPLAAGVLLVALLAGCRHCARETCGPPPACTPPPADVAKTECPAEAQPPPPPAIHIKVPPPPPPQQIIVHQAPAPPPAVVQQPAPVPAIAAQPVYQPQQLAAVGYLQPAPRARLALALDHIRLPFPRLFAVQVPAEPVPVAPLAYAPQPVCVPQPVYAQPQFVAVPACPPPAPAYPQQPLQFIPQPMPAMQAPPPRPAVSPAFDDYCKQADALIRALEASKAALGCPPR